MRAFGAHESSIRHATSLSEQTERRLPIARRNCRVRGGTAECAEELGKLQLEARRLLSVSVPGVRLRRRQVLGPRRKRQRSTACSPASAACRRFGCGCRADSCNCAQGGEGHRATARGRGQNGRLPGRRPTPRESPELHTVAIHTALGPVACPLPHRSLHVPPQLACGLAHMRGVAAGTLISLAIEPRVTAPHVIVNFRLGSRLRRPNCHSCEHISCAVCVV